MTEQINCEPIKDFFIDMITKDIRLDACILDLLDNCIDGVRRLDGHDNAIDYNSFMAKITISPDQFAIEDNCGGIDLANAKDYAFNFGRNPNAPPLPNNSIGVYGIGMKRAIFKIGKNITVASSTTDNAFKVDIDVDQWKSKKTDWHFNLEECKKWPSCGTKIDIKNLTAATITEFEDPFFIDDLIKTMARDYSFFLQKGFKVELNGESIKPYNFHLLSGGEFKPYVITYVDEIKKDVTVKIKAGLAEMSEDDVPGDRSRPEVAYYGWFVACNDRIVLAGNKDKMTVWGLDDFARWHGQYNGFMGIVTFYSSSPDELPWTTTKRDLDTSSALYRRAVKKMKEVTQLWINYTNLKKESPEEAKQAESTAEAKPIAVLVENQTMQFPKLTERARIQYSSIQYSKPSTEIKKIAKSLGNTYLSNKDVGIQTFEYYLENVVEED